MKFILTIISLLITPVFAVDTFTVEDVSVHNNENDCYMIFEESVYDFTDYLHEHANSYYDISDWCGRDMTEDFQTKDGLGRDHKSFSYSMLEDYYIGNLIDSDVIDDSLTSIEEEVDHNNSNSETISMIEEDDSSPISINSPYNFIVPFCGTLIIYFLLELRYLINKDLNKMSIRFFWNTMLLISLIPSAVFGIYLVLSYKFSSLREVNFDFLYWHVEGSIFFATICMIHFIERFKTYLAQLNNSLLNNKK